MPVIPQYNAQRNINAQTSGPMRDEASKPFEDQQKMMGTIQDVTQKWSDAQDVIQYTDAKGKFELGIADIKGRAIADPDYQNSDKYFQDLGKLKADSLSGVKNKAVAAKVGLEFGYGSQIAAMDIESIFQKKQIAHGQVMLDTGLDALANKRVVSENPAQIDQDIQNLIEYNVKSGIISEEDGVKKLDDTKKLIVKYDIYSDMATEEKQSTTLSAIRDPNGKYSYLSAKDRLSMIEESQRKIFQNNQTFKRENEISKNDRFQNIFQKANEGTLTLTDLDNEMSAAKSGDPGALSQKEILDIRKSLQSRIKTDLETVVGSDDRAAKYLTFVDGFISDETDRQKGREAIVEAFKDEILSSQEAAFLNSLKRETEEIKWSREVKTNRLIPFKNAITAIGSWFRGKENASEKDAALAIKKLLSGVAEGQDVEKIVPEILSEDRLKTQPDIKTFPSDGQMMIDPVTGVKAIVYPDGHIEVQK